MSLNFELYGVAYAKIGRSTTGKPIALYPIASTLVQPTVKDGALYYLYSVTGEYIPRKNMLVILNLTTNGIAPLAPLDYVKQDLAVSDAAKTMQTNWFSRGTMLGGIVKVPANTPKETKDEIRTSFQTGFGGSGNSFKTAVIPDNTTYEPVKIDSKSAEFQEAQRWTVAEVARRFGVPEAFAGGSVKETYANAEQRGIDLVQYAILPRSVAWQDAFNASLFPHDDTRYVKINLNGLMRGDAATRSAYYHNALMDGWMSANDVRSLEDMDPIDYGDLYMVPMNYVPRKVAATTNPYTYQAIAKESRGDHANTPLQDARKLEDLAYMAERSAVAVSQRKAIERLARKQLKAEIDALQALVYSGISASEILEKFRQATEKIAREFGDSYVSAFSAIAKKIQPIVQRQVKTGTPVDADAFDRFVKTYAYAASDRHAASRTGALEKTLAGIPDDQVKDIVDTATQEWIATVPNQQAAEETNRSANAMTVFLFAALGVTYMHVVASADSCEFCHRLDGRVVEVNGNVLSKGEDVDDGSGNIMHISKSKKHPPFHTGCECSVAPGR
jgi:HK97 family phage portal protein